MSKSSIDFNGNALVRNLDVFGKVQLPFMASLALNRTATHVRDSLKGSMRGTFTYLTPYTQNSVFIRVSTKQKLYTDIGIKEFGAKGNAAADYLKPQVYGGQVYRTRFQKRMERNMGMKGYMLPIHSSDGAQLDASGRIQAGQYTAALYGIKAMEDIRGSGNYGKFDYKTLGTYVYIKPGQIVFGRQSNSPLKPGIYRVQGSDLTMLFKELRRPPNVPAKWPFFDIARKSAERKIQPAFDEVFREVMGRGNL
jgi:hypothetical protein